MSRAAAWPAPSDEQPEPEEIMAMTLGDEDALATDGCPVEPDGTCEHGCPSWPLYLGFI